MVEGEKAHIGFRVPARQKVALSKLAEYRRFHDDGDYSVSEFARQAVEEWLARRELPEEVAEAVAGDLEDGDRRLVECRYCRQEFDRRGVLSHEEECWARDPPPHFRYNEEAERWERRECPDCGAPVPWDADPAEVEHSYGCEEWGKPLTPSS